jgi:integrase
MSRKPTPPTNAGRRFEPTVLSPDEVNRLLAAIPARSSSGARLRALVGVLYGAGLRLQEALDLLPSDVKGCQITVRNGKGGRRRVVAIDQKSCALLDTWLERRESLGLNGRQPIFSTFSVDALGKPWDPREARRSLDKAGSRAGLERVHPHGLRHSHAVRVAGGGDVRVVQRQLGHASLATTTRYLDHLTADDLVDALDALGEW